MGFKQRKLLPNQKAGALSTETKVQRLHAFFAPVLKRALLGITPEQCEWLYRGRYDKATGERIEDGLIHRETRFKRKIAAATQQAALLAAKDFMSWAVETKFIPMNPVAHVRPEGVRESGKPPLNIDQTNVFLEKATEFIKEGDAGAVAAVLLVLTALRASEITNLTPSSIDQSATVIWVWRGKSKKAKRALKIPVDFDIGALVSLALRSLSSGKHAEEPLFQGERGNKHTRDWPRDQVRRICKAAKLPLVSAHGLRGTHLTMAEEAGTTPEMMLRSAGHESRGVQQSAYLQPGATERGIQARFIAKLKLISGGAPAANEWRQRGIKVGQK